MKIKISLALICLPMIYIFSFESLFYGKPLSGVSESVQINQEPLVEKASSEVLRLSGRNIEPLKIEAYALRPLVSIPNPTYSTLSPELQGKLTATEDVGPKFRTSGFRNEPVSPSVVAEYLENGSVDQTRSYPNKSLVSSFDAGGQVTNVANTGFFNIPADSHGAAGPDHLVNVFNTSIEFYNKNGTGGVSGSLQNFFAPLGPVNLTFDPKVLYDQMEDRWVVVTLQRTDTINGDPANTSNVFVAVSETDDPNGAWFMTDINTVVNINSADRWFDYPGLAIDDEVIYLTGNMFGFGGGGGAGSRLWIIDKADFYAGNAPVVLGPIDPYAGGGASITTQPAHVYGTSPTGFGTYLVSYSRLTSSGIEFWQTVRVDNPLGAISFTQQFIAVGDIEPNVGGLPLASQAGLSTDTNSSLTVATNDTRALDAVWRDNKLYSTATIESQTQLGETSASWISFDANGTSAIALDEFGIADGENIAAGTFTFFPSIAVNLDGGIALGYSASGPTLNPGSYYTFKSTTDTGMRDSRVLRAGTDFYFRSFQGGNNRWGDYSAMVVDPNDECFWVYNKHAVTRGMPTAGNDEDGLYLSAFGEVCNDEPNGVNDTINMDENDTATTVNGASTSVLDNDTDGDTDDTLIAALVSPPDDASTFNLNANGTFSYVHNGDEASSDSFTYNACDDGTPAKCNLATVGITINPVDDAPTAVADTVALIENDGATVIDVLDNDTDPDAGAMSINSVTQPTNGAVVITNAGADLTYEPDNNYCNDGTPTDDFTYTLNGGSFTTVAVTVTCVDQPPVAVADTPTVGEDSGASTIDVLDNDTDVDGGSNAINSVTQPTNGVVLITNAGADLTYQPDLNYCNDGTPTDDFTYTLNGGSSTSVTITVTCVDDDPVAVNDGVIDVVEDSSDNNIAVLSNDTDVDGGPLNITAVGTPSNGTASVNGSNVEYTPTADYCGLDSFSYTINGGSQAIVSVDVLCVNDEPSMSVNSAVYLSLDDLANPPAQNIACQFDFGPDNEDSSQAVADMNVAIVNNPNNILTSINASNTGALSYSFLGSLGVAEVTVSLQDNGGVANNGDDTSETYTFFVNVQDYVFRDGFDVDVCQ